MLVSEKDFKPLTSIVSYPERGEEAATAIVGTVPPDW